MNQSFCGLAHLVADDVLVERAGGNVAARARCRTEVLGGFHHIPKGAPRRLARSFGIHRDNDPGICPSFVFI